MISLPVEAKLEISPLKEIPVTINEKEVESKGTKVLPTIHFGKTLKNLVKFLNL